MKGWLRELAEAFLTILTDKAAFSIMVMAIVIYALLYPQPYLSETVREAPVIVVDQDGSQTSRDFLRRMDASDAVRVVASFGDMTQASAALQRREASAIVVVPQGFERDLLAGRAAPVAALGDASHFLLYNTTMTAISTTARAFGAEVAVGRRVASGQAAGPALVAVQPLSIAAVPLFNPQGGYASYVVPAAFVLVLQQTLLVGVGLLNAAGQHPRHAPHPLRSLSARVVAAFGLYSVWTLAYLLLATKLLHLPRIGALSDMLMVALPFLLSTTLLGMTIARLLPVREWAVVALMVMGMPFFFLSGVAWPIEMLPEGLQAVARLVPSSSAIPAFVRVNQMGADWREVGSQIATLWLLVGLFGTSALCAVLLPRRPRR